MTENPISKEIVDAAYNIHKKQVLTYLRLTDNKLGLLINFNEEVIRTGITRIVNGLDEENN
jgi:GxxExxY protein